MKKEIKGIIFDVGGVLAKNVGNLDSIPYALLGKMLEIPEKTIKQAIVREILPLRRGKESSKDFWRRVCGRLGIQFPDPDTLTDFFATTYGKGMRANKQTFAIVHELKKKYPLGIVSNTTPDHADVNRKRKIYDDFDTVVLSCEVGLSKPQKEIFELAARRMEIPAENLLFIDDAARYAKAACRAGLQAITFKSPEQLESRLRKLGVLQNFFRTQKPSL
jgi:HAD superfamily hydrolase (TIGR01549 family)